MDDNLLISELTASFTKQLEWYKSLDQLVQKALSAMVLSRGDVSSVMPNVSKKQDLLNEIVAERTRIQDQAREWQERKSSIASSPESENLNNLLEQIGSAIKAFLKSEEQLKTYLEHLIKREESNT